MNRKEIAGITVFGWSAEGQMFLAAAHNSQEQLVVIGAALLLEGWTVSISEAIPGDPDFYNLFAERIENTNQGAV